MTHQQESIRGPDGAVNRSSGKSAGSAGNNGIAVAPRDIRLPGAIPPEELVTDPLVIGRSIGGLKTDFLCKAHTVFEVSVAVPEVDGD